jgi:hypothetical protein
LIAPALKRLAELREYAEYFIAAKADRVRLMLRSTALYAALALLGALVAATLLIAGSVLLLGGLAAGVGRLCGDHAWLGDVIVGGATLAIFAGGAFWAVKRQLKSLHQRIVDRYESRKRQERAVFGDDVAARAARWPRHERRIP